MSKSDVSLTYQDHFVAFIDVLGFRSLVMGSSPQNRQRIEDFFRVAKYFREKWQKIKEKKSIKVVSVSDSIFLASRRIGDVTVDIETLAHLCVAVGDMQIALATNNVWCRGAISSGDTYFDIEPSTGEIGAQAVIFGPSIVKAVELEEAMAVYPRVIVDTKVVTSLGYTSSGSLISVLNSKVLEAGWNNWTGNILHGWSGGRDELNFFRKDYPLFIDYMGEVFRRTKVHTDLATTIANNLMRSAGEAPQAYEKFRWAGDYMQMRGLKEEFPNREIIENILLQF